MQSWMRGNERWHGDKQSSVFLLDMPRFEGLNALWTGRLHVDCRLRGWSTFLGCILAHCNRRGWLVFIAMICDQTWQSKWTAFVVTVLFFQLIQIIGVYRMPFDVKKDVASLETEPDLWVVEAPQFDKSMFCWKLSWFNSSLSNALSRKMKNDLWPVVQAPQFKRCFVFFFQ